MLFRSARREGEVEEDSIQQQHNGVVVVEERGNPAGLRQTPWEKRRRERGRAAPTRDQIACYGQPYASLFIGEGEGAAPPLGSLPRGGGSPQMPSGGGQKGERGEAHLGCALGPICPRVCPLPHFPVPWALWGGAPAHLGLVPSHTWPMQHSEIGRAHV